MRTWETCTILAEKEFNKLKDQADFNKKYDPFVYIGKLACSIMSFIIAALFIVIVSIKFLESFGVDTNTVNPIDSIGRDLSDESWSTEDLLFFILLSHIFIGISIFFILTTHHGNATVGQRFATITFYAMKENETLLNSFLANTAFNNVVCTGVKQYMVMMFDLWTRGSISYEEAIITRHSRMFFRLAGASVFDYIFMIAVIVTILIISINGSGRIRYNDILDKSGKISVDKKNRPKDILSIKFGASYKKKTTMGAEGESDEEIEDDLLFD